MSDAKIIANKVVEEVKDSAHLFFTPVRVIVSEFNKAVHQPSRDSFMKSAQYAGFIDASSGRFVKPGIVPREDLPRDKPDETQRNNGNDGNEPPGLHPFVQGLLKELPKAGDVWPEDQRKLWLDTAASIFKMIYKDQQLPKPAY